jgi:hypothetical protein
VLGGLAFASIQTSVLATRKLLIWFLPLAPTKFLATSLKNYKTLPVAGRGDLQGCQRLRIPHCLHSRLTDGGKVVSLTHRPRSTPQKHYFSASGIHFC